MLREPTLRPDRLATAAQCTNIEAREVLLRLEEAGSAERLLNGSLTFRLSKTARDKLRGRLAYRPRTPFDEHWELVRAYLDLHEAINRTEAAVLLNVGLQHATRTLSMLYTEHGLLEPVGASRGRGVRYRLAKTWHSDNRPNQAPL